MAGSCVRYSSRASANIVLVVAPEAMSTGREAQVELQAWGVCSSTDQVGRSGAGAKHSREGLEAQSSERAVYPRGSSGLRVAYRAASSAELLGHVHHAKASSLPFQHDRRRAADRATTPTSSSSKYIIDWTSSGYISALRQIVEGGSWQRARWRRLAVERHARHR